MKLGIWDRLIIILWAVSLAFVTLFVLGFSHFFSGIFGSHLVARVVDIAFIVFTALYACLLWWLFPRSLPPIIKAAAFLPPLLVFFSALTL